MVHIPFKGGAPATAALVAGEIDLSFANMTDALPQLEAGTVRGLAVTSLGRSPYLPDIPSVHESVSPNFIAETWNGIIAPPKTPEAIVNKLIDALNSMADDPGVKERHAKVGSNTVEVEARRCVQIKQEMSSGSRSRKFRRKK
jgi:tripartite-type tricarboxylate transporter receptor subunit TctC